MNARLYKRLLSLLLTSLAGLEGKTVSDSESVRLREMVMNLANANLMMEKQLKELLDEKEISNCSHCAGILGRMRNIIYGED